MSQKRVRTVQAYPKDALCCVEGCERSPYAFDYCQLHWRRWRTHGDPLISHARVNLPDAIEISPTDLAWCAGIIEGEGTVRIDKARGNSHGGLAVSVTSTDFDMLEPLRSWFGGSLAPVATREECRDAWRWSVRAKQAYRVLRSVEPFCRVQRVREKILLGMKYQEQKRQGSGSDRFYREEQHRYYDRTKNLNVRGARR